MHFVGSKGLLFVLFCFNLSAFFFFFLIVFPIQCRVFSSRRSLRFVNVWLLRFLLSVSDVQPDVLSASSSFCSIHTAPLTPFRSLHQCPTATPTLRKIITPGKHKQLFLESHNAKEKTNIWSWKKIFSVIIILRNGRKRNLKTLSKIPWRRELQPNPVFLPGKPHVQRSLVGDSPRGCKRLRLDLPTEQ